jgi:hypothetical protein
MTVPVGMFISAAVSANVYPWTQAKYNAVPNPSGNAASACWISLSAKPSSASAERLREVFTDTYLHQPPAVENAMGIQLSALLGQFDAACAAADELAEAAIAHFEQHPDAKIITSFPGLGMLAGARVLAEIGDDRSRFADARGLKAFAGSAPITRAAARKPLSCTGISKTGGWPPWARSGRCRRCVPRRAPVATSTLAAPPATGTTKPNGICSTSSSANFTTVCRPASSTTNTGRFHLLSLSQLDF